MLNRVQNQFMNDYNRREHEARRGEEEDAHLHTQDDTQVHRAAVVVGEEHSAGGGYSVRADISNTEDTHPDADTDTDTDTGTQAEAEMSVWKTKEGWGGPDMGHDFFREQLARKKVDFGKSLGRGLLAQPPALKRGVLTDWDPLEVSEVDISLVKGVKESVATLCGGECYAMYVCELCV